MEKLKLLHRLLVEDTGPFSCGRTIAEFCKGKTKEDGEEREKIARRIVACVNACREIDISVLEIPDYSVKTELDTLDAQIAGRLKAEADAIKNADLYLAASRDVQSLTAQRDELLAALRALYGWTKAEVEHFGATCPDDFIIEMVEKAIGDTK